jgi:hypothetical protein
MSASLQHVACCGMKEIANLQASKNSLEALKVILDSPTTGFQFSQRVKAPKRLGQIVFTQANSAGDNARPNYGYHFADYIRNQKLGLVVESAKLAPNPNYPRGHMIKTWIWTPDPAALWKWWKKNGGQSAKPLTWW